MSTGDTQTHAPSSEGLSEYLGRVQSAIESHVSSAWVRFEIANITGNATPNAGGHLYLELIEKDSNGKSIAKARAALWGGKRVMLQRFYNETGLQLAIGMSVLGKLSCNFKPEFGLTLILEQLDPSFTLGEAERRLRELRLQLEQRGLLTLNRSLIPPSDFKHVAVISPDNAAGLGDFNTVADRLAKHRLCEFHYFPAVFQGSNLYPSMKAAFISAFELHNQLLASGEKLDALVVIRGGGDANGLNELNRFDVANLASKFPVPVLVGIGHDRDNTILDELACVRCPTPSLAAAHISDVIISTAQAAATAHHLTAQQSKSLHIQAEQHLVSVQHMIAACRTGLLNKVQQQLMASRYAFETQASKICQQQGQQLSHCGDVIHQQAITITEQACQALIRSRELMPSIAMQPLQQGIVMLRHQAQELLINNPLAILARGYAFVQDSSGVLVTSPEQVNSNDEIHILVKDGTINAKVMLQEVVNE
ncbi:exodeoxyribonuclease VII large subunit [Aeromonas veronii]|uniref:Exodeoxyribonuclease 7 large subunit n=1 Tax=Aeromonas veronii TaxID=654 RepID=A0A4S5CGX7_AERVE|nr:exodeoxyribonuclease VII large subunit [Aeromonas veronii]THJ44929.1 exodeoxyribonuclease VII large subunit [Aeromonas veronii]